MDDTSENYTLENNLLDLAVCQVRSIEGTRYKINGHHYRHRGLYDCPENEALGNVLLMVQFSYEFIRSYCSWQVSAFGGLSKAE